MRTISRTSLQCLIRGEKADDDVDPAAPSAEPVAKAEETAEPAVAPESAPAEVDGDGVKPDVEVNGHAAEDDKKNWSPVDVLRYLELTFALCVKVPDLLDEIFAAYPHLTAENKSSLYPQHVSALSVFE